MYKNIGNKIKKTIASTTILAIILYSVVTAIGVYLIFVEGEEELGLMLALLGIALSILAWISSWYIYAFGELVQNSTIIAKICQENNSLNMSNARTSAPRSFASPVAAPVNPEPIQAIYTAPQVTPVNIEPVQAAPQVAPANVEPVQAAPQAKFCGSCGTPTSDHDSCPNCNN